MPHIYLCFLWHMHQPFYKDLISGEYKMPWTRLHALKDYCGMVRILEEFPQIGQTFNLVPSLVAQIEEYAAGEAVDPFLRLALKPAESLTQAEQAFLLTNFFHGTHRLIFRLPRYGELYEAWRAADRNVQRAAHFFSAAALRDLQVLSQLAWFDEECLTGDVEIRELVDKGRGYSPEDQALVGRKQVEALGRVLPVYREFAARGQIEISTTPFYHPILPLVCDSSIAAVSHPYVALPGRFRYPGDARAQLERAREFIGARFGAPPAGLWPSEGSVSDEALGIAAEAGYQWAGTDNGVLSRTLGWTAGIEETYRPYLWRQDGREIRVVFRDHFLSDLIGFVYARTGAVEAARDFLDRIRENCRGLLAGGRDVFVPIILDGENAWEHYERNGRPFLRELYRRISEDPTIRATPVSEGLRRVEPQPLERIFPGSWIGANFDVWIGHEEDNKAWEYLLRARQTYDQAGQAGGLPPDALALAYEELLIAEGSDWCWWYGPEHQSESRPEFDELYRAHLANVYRALRLPPPEELSRPILKVAVAEFHAPATGPVRPVIDGEVTSYFEWLGAGLYRVDPRSGAMHGKRYLIRELRYGSDGMNLYLRVDFEAQAEEALDGMAAHFQIQPVADSSLTSLCRLALWGGQAEVKETRLARPRSGEDGAEFALRKVLEGRLSLAALGVGPGGALRLQLSLWREGLPMDAIPHQGWLEISTAEPTDWPL
ncbi:MAG: glycoside hydrolase family 57 protein [Acidobacteriota bacterium]